VTPPGEPRVLWVSHFVPYPPKGGVLQRGYGLVTGVARHLELHLLALNQPRLLRQTLPSAPDRLGVAVAHLQRHCASVAVSAIPSETLPLGRVLAGGCALVLGRSYTEAWLWSTRLGGWIAEAVRRVKPDIVHFDTVSLAPYMSAIPAGIPVSLGHHNIESLMMRRRAMRASGKLQTWYLREEARRICRLERVAARRAVLQVVCSDLDAKRLRRLGHRGRIVVAENGVGAPELPACDAASATETPAQPDVAFVGRMSAYTNRDAAEVLVRDIWPIVRARLPEARLHIVGSSPPQCALDLAAGDPAVKVWGFVDSVTDVVPGGAIFVCPIRDGGGTKLKILDAANRGMPIVAHPIALEGLSFRPGVDVLTAESPGEFASAIEALAASRNLRAQLVERAYAIVRSQYSFDSIARRLSLDFRSVCRPSD
jgi:glycosyltransferase involved in cell wall biosynthesis